MQSDINKYVVRLHSAKTVKTFQSDKQELFSNKTGFMLKTE